MFLKLKMGDHHSVCTFKVFDILRSKNFLIFILFVLATSISIWLVSAPTPNIRNIMTETGKQFTNLKNINVMKPKKALPKDVTMAETYLELLGFSENPSLYPDVQNDKAKIPVVVTGVLSSTYENAFKLIDSVEELLPGKQIMIFDLGLDSYELVALKKHCNESTNCFVKSFDFDKFPNHVEDMAIKAYRPIALQEALNEFQAVIWTDDEDYFITPDIQNIVQQAEKAGIVAWPLESNEPTSALTHPSMFEYFKTKSASYFFHRMVNTNHLVIYNTRRIHKELMLPWVQCALTENCIFPRGAQNVGCNFQRKPKYRYSGCHRYDTSALNVILGQVFDYSVDSYMAAEDIFGIKPEPELEFEDVPTGNTTLKDGRTTTKTISVEVTTNRTKANTGASKESGLS